MKIYESFSFYNLSFVAVLPVDTLTKISTFIKQKLLNLSLQTRYNLKTRFEIGARYLLV